MFDDRPNIVQNTALHVDRLGGDGLLYAAYSFQPGNGSRALSMLTFALDYWRAGLDASAFKVTNILIHVLTTLALAVFLRRLLASVQWPPRRAMAGALILAMVWALHPLQVSSVLYVVQRMQTLVTLFMVLAMWAYLCMRQAQMKGERSRQHGVLMMLFWALGLASKEDAALLPAYLLVMELAVLRFAAASPKLAWLWRKGYLLMAVAGVAAYALVVVPHYWHWTAYPGRDFSSWERLLSQGRVLVMYLGQIVWPSPSRLPFYYDDFAVSHSLWQPVTTLPAWLLVFGLLAWAWCWRTLRPLFAFGLLLFFAGHFMTSNVVNLELVFEHRNHLPLVGVLVAMADLCVAGWRRLALRPSLAVLLLAGLVFAEGGAAAWRAYTWGEPLRFALETRRLAPNSERAWLALNAAYVERSSFKVGNPWFDRAIAVCEEGGAATGSAVLFSNAVIYKTIRGDVTAEDWARLQARLPHMTMNVQNRGIALNLLSNVEKGMALDREEVVRVWEAMTERTDFTSDEYLRMAAFIYNKTEQPERAYPFMRRAVEMALPDDPAIAKLLADLEKVGMKGWAQGLNKVREKVAGQGAVIGEHPP